VLILNKPHTFLVFYLCLTMVTVQMSSTIAQELENAINRSGDIAKSLIKNVFGAREELQQKNLDSHKNKATAKKEKALFQNDFNKLNWQMEQEQEQQRRFGQSLRANNPQFPIPENSVPGNALYTQGNAPYPPQSNPPYPPQGPNSQSLSQGNALYTQGNAPYPPQSNPPYPPQSNALYTQQGNALYTQGNAPYTQQGPNSQSLSQGNPQFPMFGNAQGASQSGQKQVPVPSVPSRTITLR
jgi:hypothetical protein